MPKLIAPKIETVLRALSTKAFMSSVVAPLLFILIKIVIDFIAKVPGIIGMMDATVYVGLGILFFSVQYKEITPMIVEARKAETSMLTP